MSDLDVVIESMRYLSQTGEAAEPCPPPGDEELEEVSRLLGKPLPPSYVEFMRKAHDILPEGFDIYWVGPPDMGRRHIAVANEVERCDEESPLPDCLIAFYEDESGDQYCFDTRPPEALKPVAEPDPDASAIYAILGEDPIDSVETKALQSAAETGGDPNEYPVVVWDRAKGCEQIDECLYVAGDNFVDWLKQFLKEQF